MKAINLLFVLIAFTFTACTNAEIENIEDNTSSFESMKSLYGIESAAFDQQLSNIPSVTSEEMGSVLDALYKNSINAQDCRVENTNEYYGAGNDKKTVMMTAEYQARTRSGQYVDKFALCVSLNFNIESKKGSVYYVGTTYSSACELFTWKGYGASLSSRTDGSSDFSSTTYLYFRVSDQNNCLVKVAVNFKGNYNFETNKGAYSFTLNTTK